MLIIFCFLSIFICFFLQIIFNHVQNILKFFKLTIIMINKSYWQNYSRHFYLFDFYLKIFYNNFTYFLLHFYIIIGLRTLVGLLNRNHFFSSIYGVMPFFIAIWRKYAYFALYSYDFGYIFILLYFVLFYGTSCYIWKKP